MIKKVKNFINEHGEQITSTAPAVSSAFGIKQGTVGQIGSAIGSLIPGPMGTVVQVASQFAGTGDHRTVNEQTGEIEGDNGTGIIGGIQKLFGWGRSTNSLINKQSRIKTSLADQQLTQDLNYNFYSDPNNSVNGSIFATAAEGGIMRRPVDALVSKGELIYDPVQKKLTKVPGNKGKANTDDDVFTKLQEGWIVVPNSDNSKKLTTNNKTVAYNLEPMVDKPNIKMSKGTIEARDRIIKKVSRLTEAIKDEPQEYAMYRDGTGKDGASRKTPDLSDMFLYRQRDGKFVMQDINGNRYDVPEMMLPYIQGDEHGYWFGPQTGIAPSAGKWNGSMNFAKQLLNSKNVAKLRNIMTRVLPKGAKPANIKGPVKPVTGTSPDVLGKPKTAQEAAQMARNERTANMWQQLTSKGSVPQKTLEGPQTWATTRGSSNLWENPMALQSGDDIASAINTAYYLNKGLPTAFVVSTMLGSAGTFLTYEATKDKRSTAANTATTMPINTDKPTVVMTQEKPVESTIIPAEATTENEKKKAVASKKSSINKPSSSKNTTASRVTTSTTPSPEDTVVRRPVYEEPVKTVTAPVDDTKVYGREGDVRYDYLAPERKVNPAELGRSVDSGINYNGSNWRDGLYRMAVLSQPWWGREKAEPVDYNSPVYKYMPTAIDVSSQLESADQNYALSRYNFANLYPNTGAGMAAGLQAASNRAKQYADIRQWQTNAQNELIGKNAGIYNNWSNEHARILNDVRNKYAQNRATARNINRQNMATALNNYGVMLSDDKKMNIEAQNNQLKANMLKPFIESVYENSDELIPTLAPYTMNRNVKKKSSTR